MDNQPSWQDAINKIKRDQCDFAISQLSLCLIKLKHDFDAFKVLLEQIETIKKRKKCWEDDSEKGTT